MAITGDRLTIDGIGHFLSDHVLRVPTNQRAYAWEEDHVEDLWHDIQRAMDGKPDDYFIGSLVLSAGGEDALEVVDGQQRLATATIVLGVIRDYFMENGHEQRAKVIEDKYLFDTDEDTLEPRPRLSLNTADNVFFHTHIVFRCKSDRRTYPLVKKDVRGLPDSNKRIAIAGDVIRKLVFAYVANTRPEEIADRLMRIVKYIRDHVKMICVLVENDDDAYTIFETLNDRGLDLSKADLLKNHLFRISGQAINDVETKWNNMVGSLESFTRKEIVVDYIRYLWISMNGHVRTKDLYKEIKLRISHKGAAVSLAHNLSESAKLYASILNSDHPEWSEHGEDTRADLATLITLGIERLHPITLAAVRTFNKAELKKAIYYLVSASVRILIASPSPGGVFEQNVAEIAPLIRKPKTNQTSITTAKALAAAMNKKIVPSDAAFEAQFAIANVSQSQLARYYLRVLENSKDDGEPQPARVRKEQAKGNIEHIMPQSYSGAIVKSCGWRISGGGLLGFDSVDEFDTLNHVG